MSEQNGGKLNRLERHLPEGLLVDAAWLQRRGYYPSLRKKYVDRGWLERPVRRVYQRPRGPLRWEQVVISLQTLLQFPTVVGGRTALELQGYAHFVPQAQTEVHLYGRKRLPTWVNQLPLPTCFVFHNSGRLFDKDAPTRGLTGLSWNLEAPQSPDPEAFRAGLSIQPWGQWGWPPTLSTPERALFELLDELPGRESFDHVDKLMEGLVGLSPGRLQTLLTDCCNVKVKRLFFFFADRHDHGWLKRIDRAPVDLGKGKRMLVRGGKLDPTYGITVPGDLNAVP